MEKKLTAKQAKFVEYYLANGNNATQACRDAGYKGNTKTLTVVGTENLVKPSIKAVIEEAKAKDSKKLNITRESLLADIQYAKDKARESLETDYPQYQHFLKASEMQAKMLGLNEPDKIEFRGIIEDATPTFGEDD